MFYCPHHIDGYGKYKKNCKCRKPEPLMITKAAKKYSIDLQQSVLIGDKETDIEAGKRAGVGKNIFINELIQ